MEGSSTISECKVSYFIGQETWVLILTMNLCDLREISGIGDPGFLFWKMTQLDKRNIFPCTHTTHAIFTWEIY